MTLPTQAMEVEEGEVGAVIAATPAPIATGRDVTETAVLNAQLTAARLETANVQLRLEVALLEAALAKAQTPVAVTTTLPAVTAAGPVPTFAAVTAATSDQVTTPCFAGMDRNAVSGKRSEPKRYPPPKEFVPPVDHRASSITYVEKYLFDLKNYAQYGMASDVPPFLAFSQTSTGTFELVQEMAARDEAMPEGTHMPIDEVCAMIARRYLPSIDRSLDARMRLLGGEIVMRGDEMLAAYKARFLSELALATRGAGQTPMSEFDKMLLYRNGMAEELKDACVSDAQARRLTDFEEVHMFAEAMETRIRMRRGVPARSAAQAMTMQTNFPPAPAPVPTAYMMQSGGRGRGRGLGGRGGVATGRGSPRALDRAGPSNARGGGRAPRGGHAGGRGNRGVDRRRDDGFERARPYHRAGTNAPSGKINSQGVPLTKMQFFTLLDQHRCWYCAAEVGSPPSHVGDTCPRRP